MAGTTSQATIRDPGLIHELPRTEVAGLEHALDDFEFRVTAYYARLVQWSDPEDPLRRIVLPHSGEVHSGLGFDASNEAENIRVHGLQHKYRPTALLLVNDVCAAYCRFCFRKRFTLATGNREHLVSMDVLDHAERETTFDVRGGLSYIRQHPEINNVLLTGGDPLMLSVTRLAPILEGLRAIPHVRTIRIGTKVPAFDPHRVTDALAEVLAEAGGSDSRLYVITHFNHSREVTVDALAAIDRLLTRGVVVTNQTPLLHGVNDNADELERLLQRLSDAGVPPYYLFQCRPTHGNERFLVSLQEGLGIVQEVRSRLSGLAKRFRFVASHDSGKIEIVGILDGSFVFRYHEARVADDEDRIFTWPASRPLFWLDEAVASIRR